MFDVLAANPNSHSLHISHFLSLPFSACLLLFHSLALSPRFFFSSHFTILYLLLFLDIKHIFSSSIYCRIPTPMFLAKIT